jgi:seryl-tRNA synthetase
MLPTVLAVPFAESLVEQGLLVPAGPLGVPGRGAVFEAVLSAFDALVMRAAHADGAQALLFPPVIDRAILERTGYLEGFPTLCGSVHAFAGTEAEATAFAARVARGDGWDGAMAPTDLVLTPAACYPFYPTCRGILPADGRHVTLRGWVFRQEPSAEPTRLRAFRVREFVRVGAPAEVLAWRDAWRVRGESLLRALQLDVRADAASDPFFGRAGRMLANGQRQQQLKFELLVPVNDNGTPTACCSFNCHLDKFGSVFDIQLATGGVAHTACLGFGLERVVLALFRAHGLDPVAWPDPVQRQLWPDGGPAGAP